MILNIKAESGRPKAVQICLRLNLDESFVQYNIPGGAAWCVTTRVTTAFGATRQYHTSSVDCYPT
jgi:hypothetical protein